MPSGVYERTPEKEAARIAKFKATRAKQRKGKPAGRDWAAEYAKRKAKAGGVSPNTVYRKTGSAIAKGKAAGSAGKTKTVAQGRPSRAKNPARPGWSRERAAKFKATMAAKRAQRELAMIARQDKRAGKMALLNGARPVGRPKKDNRPTSVTVLEADGSLATYVLTTVQAYVRQP